MNSAPGKVDDFASNVFSDRLAQLSLSPDMFPFVLQIHCSARGYLDGHYEHVGDEVQSSNSYWVGIQVSSLCIL